MIFNVKVIFKKEEQEKMTKCWIREVGIIDQVVCLKNQGDERKFQMQNSSSL